MEKNRISDFYSSVRSHVIAYYVPGTALDTRDSYKTWFQFCHQKSLSEVECRRKRLYKWNKIFNWLNLVMNGLLCRARKLIPGTGRCVSNVKSLSVFGELQCFSITIDRTSQVEDFVLGLSDYVLASFVWRVHLLGGSTHSIRVCKNILELLYNFVPSFNFYYF